MRTLILMRHAKSDWSQAGVADHDRPLNARGKSAAPLMAEYLASQDVPVDVILTSSARRAQQTVKRVRRKWASDAEVLNEPSLYLASPDELASHVHALHDSWHHALLVGHNPGLSQLASQLANEPIALPTAAVAILQADIDHWDHSLPQGEWTLQHFWKPRDLA